MSTSGNPNSRPACIVHRRALQEPDDARHPGSDELLGIGAPPGAATGLTVMGVHHELLRPAGAPPGPTPSATRRNSSMCWKGQPQVWIDGEVHDLVPGDAVGFPKGTGIAHTFLNNTDSNVRLLVIGEKSRPGNKIHYPLHPAHNAGIGTRHWQDRPERPLGSHDGLPDRLRAKIRSLSDRWFIPGSGAGLRATVVHRCRRLR